MFPSPEGETALETGHILKLTIVSNSPSSRRSHFHSRVPHLHQDAELLLLPPPPAPSQAAQPPSLPHLWLSRLCKPLENAHLEESNEEHMEQDPEALPPVTWGAAAWAGQR